MKSPASIQMSIAAHKNLEETDVDVLEDVSRIRNGLIYDQLLAECLDGADEDQDEDQVGGWVDYVDAVVHAAMSSMDVEALYEEARRVGDREMADLCSIAFSDPDAARKVMLALDYPYSMDDNK